MEYYTSTVCLSENWEPLWWKRVAAQNLQQHSQHAVWAFRSGGESSIGASRFELPRVWIHFSFVSDWQQSLWSHFEAYLPAEAAGNKSVTILPNSISNFVHTWNMGLASWLSCRALVCFCLRLRRNVDFNTNLPSRKLKKLRVLKHFLLPPTASNLFAHFFFDGWPAERHALMCYWRRLLFTPLVPVSMWTSVVCARVTWGATRRACFFCFCFFFAKASLKVKTGWEPGRCVPAAWTKFSHFHSNTERQARSIPREQHFIRALTWDNRGRSGGGLDGREHSFQAPTIVWPPRLFQPPHPSNPVPPSAVISEPPASRRVRIMFLAVKTRCLPGGNAEGLSDDD